MPKGIKKQPVKRKYTKRTSKLVKPAPVDEELDTEIKTLALICSVFSNWNPEQRRRNLQFINSKYSEPL